MRPHLPNIVAAVEEAFQEVNPNVRDEVRLKSIGILAKLPLQKGGKRTAEENRALRELRNDQSIVILRADKGNSTVVFENQDYDRKISALLDEAAHAKVKRDPMNQTQTQLHKLLADIFKSHPEQKALYLNLIGRNGSEAGFYGLSKIYKPGVPLRPIVDFTSSAEPFQIFCPASSPPSLGRPRPTSATRASMCNWNHR